MTQTSETQATAQRRSYSKAFKVDIVSQCQAADASVARIARNHGLNANMVHRWIRELNHSCTGHNLVPAEPGFVPVALTLPAKASAQPSIEICIPRPSGSVVVRCLPEQVSECATLLREWLG